MKEYIKVKMGIQELLEGEFKNLKYVEEVSNNKEGILEVLERQYNTIKEFVEKKIL